MSVQPAKRLRPGVRVLAIAVPALVAAVLVGVWLFGTDAQYTGTNTVAPRYPLPALAPGQTLCVEGLTLPAHSNAIQLQLQSQPEQHTTVTMRLTAGGRRQVARAQIPFVGFGGTFRIAPLPRDAPAKACLTTDRQLVTEAGIVSAGPGGVAYIDGKPIGQLTVAYLRLPPRTLISTLPAGARRASLFRAGFVGPWTYFVVAFMLLLLWAVGIRLVARRTR